ncbi:EAL domain-containing protein [Dasania sp. GY-MA-18]|uniref:EAL domain-containing protein n=1 Tax=Dasania phycosphaerae TaxID=2950436 RepID=A0A9J6RPA6_9GAMM|nr:MULTISPECIES: EAL domain-containing protein [Dasania]MCR8923953.1 EAL domain-containing protein [Dasania sp. GY-MA-18]MCZ0866387.1 EAL domain-containing protein [Dasania phycosphaerae]MCZ0870111.1 EAL domain-containing protein [Dasania phycosphaerae]
MSITCVNALFISSSPNHRQLLAKLCKQFEYSEIEISYSASAELAQQCLSEKHYDILLIGTESELEQRLELLSNLPNDESYVPATLLLSHSKQAFSQHKHLHSRIDSLRIQELTPALLEHCIRYAIRHKADEARLLKLAHHDPLTGLANRLAFKKQLLKLIAQTKRSGHLLALMIVDLDNFKLINDALGHDVGDKVLADAAEHLQQSVRESDLVARLGGDEFAIIATHLHSPKDAATLARTIIERCHFQQHGTHIKLDVSCSIGIALYPNDSQEHCVLLKHADNALFKAKQAGKRQFSFADQELNFKDKFQHALDSDIKHPKFLKQLQLYYQPIVDTKSQQLIGAEALLRWNNPSQGLLAPDKFLNAIESNGLMNKVGNWVVHNACMQHLAWVKQGLPAIAVSVNLTAQQLENSYLINVIKKLIHHQQFNPHYLCLELSEADAFKCSEKVQNSLYKLHELGVHLTIDNFGKDYCSLTQLHRLPIDSIKIDRSLIQRAEYNEEYADVTEAIIQLGKILNLNIIAQGIENSRCLEYISTRDCHQAQGFYIAKPLNHNHFMHWMGQQNQRLSNIAH